jgi:Alpha-2-macroglobulin bait region domain
VSFYSPNLNEDVQIKITSTVAIESVFVHVVSKGILLRSARVWIEQEDDGTYSAIFEFKISGNYIPGTQIIAYYIDSRGNFITGSKYVSFQNPFKNYVSYDSNILFSSVTRHIFASLISFQQKWKSNQLQMSIFIFKLNSTRQFHWWQLTRGKIKENYLSRWQVYV